MAKVITLRLDTVNGTYLCDTYKDSSIQITKRVQSIDTLNSSQGVITQQTFRVPLIGGMADALGDLTELQIAPKVDIRKSIKGSIIVDGYPRFNGSFQVVGIYKNEESNLKEVELLFKGSETDLKATLTAIKLSELLDGETLPYTMGEIYSYLNDVENYISDGYAWPLIDYGQRYDNSAEVFSQEKRQLSDPDNPLTQADFKPAIFMWKVFSLLPVSITVDTSANDLLNQIIPLHNNDETIPTLTTSINKFNGYLETDTNRSNTIALSGTTASSVPLVFDEYFQYDTSFFNLAGGYYTTQITDNHIFQVILDFNIQSLTLATGQVFVVAKISNVVGSSTITSVVNVDTTTTNYRIVKDIGGLAYVGSQLKLELEVINIVSGALTSVNFTVNSGTRFELTKAVAANGSSFVDIGKSSPELTAWDCVRTIITQCNGVLETTENGYNIKPWVKWVDEGSVYNLEDKIDANKDLSIEPTNVTGAKSIVLTYQTDTDFLNKIFTDLFERPYGNLYIRDTGTDFTKEEFKIDIPFAATPMTYVDNSNVVIPKFMNQDLKLIKAKPRLLYHNTFTGSNGSYMTTLIYLKDISSPTIFTISNIPFVGHWSLVDGGYNTNDYNFGTTLNFWRSSGFPNNTLYERFWKQYLAETYGPKSRKVKLSLRISQNDFDNFKMNEKLYYKGNLLRFLSINNLDIINEEFTDCELVFRVTEENIDIAPYYPYDIINQIVQFKDSTDNSVVSVPDATDLRTSCEAYGYFYDANLNQCVQRGNIIQI